MIDSMPGGYPITLTRGTKAYVAHNPTNPGQIVVRDLAQGLETVAWRSKRLQIDRLRAVDLNGDGRESFLIRGGGRLLHFDPRLD